MDAGHPKEINRLQVIALQEEVTSKCSTVFLQLMWKIVTRILLCGAVYCTVYMLFVYDPPNRIETLRVPIRTEQDETNIS
jgi:hypothetical protein